MSNTDQELMTVWEEVKKLLETKGYFDAVVLSTYFSDTQLYQLNQRKASVMVHHQFDRLILQGEKEKIEEALHEVTGNNELVLDIIWEEELKKFSETKINAAPVEEKDNLIPDFRFENFVEGPSNSESFKAALACACKPQGFLYSPLYIYGNSGLGKTHLLHAIGNFIKDHNPQLKILYLTSDDFITRVVNAAHNKTLKDLKEKMMQLDVLLLDDIQFLAGDKITSSETLFNIYNQLQRKKKLIVITSDKKPWEIKELEERLVSRLSNGLTYCIESPEFDTALKILRMKMRDRSVDDIAIDDEVLSYIATYYAQDVRRLEGALNRLIFYSIQFGNSHEINYKLAMEAFKDDADLSGKGEITVLKVKKCVADYYGISRAQLISKNKTKTITDARHIAIYLCRKHMDLPFAKIGNEFGRRDHSTIINACNKIDTRLRTDIPLKLAVSEIEKQLFQQ